MKYRIRKLIFLAVLAAMAMAPFAYTEYESRTTTDPFILVAREVEGFGKGVDVLGAEAHRNIPNRLVLFMYIETFPEWDPRKDYPNFKVAVIQAAARYDFDSVLILIGWDFPPAVFRVQGLWQCEDLRRSSCVWQQVPSVVLTERFRPWPGIGNP